MTGPITIRLSRPVDEPALSALAALDSARLVARPHSERPLQLGRVAALRP